LDSDYSTESESSENDEDHEVDDHRTQRKVKRTRAKKIDPRREATYEVFKELIWPRLIYKSVAISRLVQPSTSTFGLKSIFLSK
jgi:hypothetical protein